MDDRVAKGMVFGVFDGLHEGHKHFLADAASRCESLTVVIAQDASVERLKRKTPKRPLAERIEAIQAFNPQFAVISGDEVEGEWTALKTNPPGMVFLGYDQENLVTELRNLGIPYTTLPAHKPDTYKSGILDG